MKVDQHIAQIIEGSKMIGSLLYLSDQLDRKTYIAVNKVLAAAGGQWNKKLKAHEFPGPAYELLDPVFTVGEIECPKDMFDFYPTPPELALKLVERFLKLYPINGREHVLEPSAGHGVLVEAFIRCTLTQQDLLSFYMVEIQQSNVEVLKKRFDSLNSNRFTTIHADHLSNAAYAGPGFNRVIMNPPFTKQLDIDHVMHAETRMLKGASCMAIMSGSVLFRTNNKTKMFRDFLADRGGYLEPIPGGAFKSSGTMVNSCVAYFSI